MSALAGTISAPFAPGRSGAAAMRFLRSALSLAIALAILAVALPAAFGAGARRSGADPLRVFSSGSALSVDAGGAARLSVAGLVPGQGRMATIRVSNAGSEAAPVTLATRLSDSVGPGGEALSSALIVRIAAPGGPILYRGALAGLGRLGLGEIGAGGERAFDFSVTLPRSAGNEVEGSAISAVFSWTSA